MDKSKFEEIVVTRIKKDIKQADEELERKKQTIGYFYDEVLKEFDNKLRENIHLYNEVLDKHYKDLKIFLFYGDSYGDTIEKGYGKKIILLIDDKSTHPTYSTPITNFDHCLIYFEKERGINENYFFASKYFVAYGHAMWEENELRLTTNENKKENIINSLNSFLIEFFKFYFEKSYKLQNAKKKD